MTICKCITRIYTFPFQSAIELQFESSSWTTALYHRHISWLKGGVFRQRRIRQRRNTRECCGYLEDCIMHLHVHVWLHAYILHIHGCVYIYSHIQDGDPCFLDTCRDTSKKRKVIFASCVHEKKFCRHAWSKNLRACLSTCACTFIPFYESWGSHDNSSHPRVWDVYSFSHHHFILW